MMQETHLGWGSIDLLFEILDQHSAQKIFLVCGKDSYTKTGAAEKLRKIDEKHVVTRFSDFASNTKTEDVARGSAVFRKNNFDTIISIGGGSAIDVAKLIFATKLSDIDTVIDTGAKVFPSDIVHIAVPTTAGTGSEATHFAVVYRDKIKYSVGYASLLPNIAIVDPQLTMSMSPHLTATTGFDALAQGIESYWSAQSTDESIEYASTALEYIVPSLETAIHTPTRSSRENMAFGAHYAGKAINISKTTAPHALSYFFTSYFGIPHGHAVALTLGAFLKFNMAVSSSDVSDIRGDIYVRDAIGKVVQCMKCSTANEAAKMVEKIMQGAGLATRLSSFGFKESDIDSCVRSVNVERLRNNPRILNNESLREILFNLL